MAENGFVFKRDPKYTYWRWRIFAVTWLGYAGLYLTRKSFAVAKIGLEQDPEIQMTSYQMSLIDGCYLATYAIGQFVWGMVGDRFGTRKVILWGLFLSVVAGFAMGVSSLVLFFALFLGIQGFCQSTGWAPLAKNVSNWFSQSERGFIMGLWCTNYPVGGAIASPFAGYCAEHLSPHVQGLIASVNQGGVPGFFMQDWRFAFYGPALVLFLVYLILAFFQKNKPEDVGLPKIETYRGEPEAVLVKGQRPEDDVEGSWSTTFKVIKSPMVLRLGLVYFLLKPARYAILLWSPKYISETIDAGMTKSGAISAAFELAGPLAVLVGGLASDKLFQSRRMPPAVIGAFCLGVVLLAFSFIVNAYPLGWVIGVLLFVIGFLLFIPDSLSAATAAVDFGTKKGASTAVGFINGCGSTGAIIGGTLPGLVKDKYGWTPVFVFLACMVLVAGFLLAQKWHELPPTAEQGDEAEAGEESAG